ncbi:MAG: sigma-70 family RNA polymerase sigma factor [Myxococcaceae bacterium]|nr:sigma-70 family RNA polymerase sigma factor [Myxococcaceae bacterium]MCA3012107.1 sigma-70 family RNA polymerase sigma factor [Myxococcaceae bacterium]
MPDVGALEVPTSMQGRAAVSHLRVVGAPSEVSDEQLVAGIRAGDARLANELVRRCGPRAKGAIRRLLRRDEPDLVQVVLMELVQTIDRWRGECSLSTWVERLAAHVVYKRLRRERLEARLFEGLATEALEVAGRASAERASMTADALERVQALLSDLPHELVNTWLLFDVYGLTTQEVAAALEVSPVAAQSRVSRARRDVQARLARDPELLDVINHLEVRR